MSESVTKRRESVMSIIGRILGDNKLDDSNNDVTPEMIEDREPRERVIGKIIKLGEGWGFISCKAIPYTRIFFHWSALNQDTLRFPELRRGMSVEFEPLEIEGKGYRAIKIKVTEE